MPPKSHGRALAICIQLGMNPDSKSSPVVGTGSVILR